MFGIGEKVSGKYTSTRDNLTLMKNTFGLTSGESFLKKKERSIHDYSGWLFLAFLGVMMWLSWKILVPLYFPPHVAMEIPATTKEMCQQIISNKWSETYDIFKYCQKLI